MIPPEAMDLVRKWEGLRLEPYLCTANYWTIGYGHVIRSPTGDMLTSASQVAPRLRWTNADADQALLQDLGPACDSARSLCAVSDPQMVAALASFVFNLGAGSLRASTLRKKVLAGEHEEVPAQFARWIYAGGVKSRGLARRRAEEASLYMSAPSLAYLRE